MARLPKRYKKKRRLFIAPDYIPPAHAARRTIPHVGPTASQLQAEKRAAARAERHAARLAHQQKRSEKKNRRKERARELAAKQKAIDDEHDARFREVEEHRRMHAAVEREHNLRSHDRSTNRVGNSISELHSEHLYLADAAYGDEGAVDKVNLLGYEKLEPYSNKTLHVYRHEGHKEIVFAHRGTVKSDYEDIYHDAIITAGGNLNRTKRLKTDTYTMLRVIQENPKYTYSATGHSLGGTTAALSASQLNIRYSAFNAGSSPAPGFARHIQDLQATSAVAHNTTESDIKQLGHFYHYGSDGISANIEKSFFGSTHHNFKAPKSWNPLNHAPLAHHGLSNFKKHLHPKVRDTAEYTVSGPMAPAPDAD